MTSTEDPSWLDPAERAAWLGLIGVAMRLPAVLDAQMLRDAGITMFEYLAMAMLSEQPDHTLPMSMVASMSTASLPRLSHVVRRLEERGWMMRRPSPDDGRTTLVSLTDSGWAKVVASAPGHAAFVRALVFDPLTSQQVDALKAITEVLLPRMWPEGVPRPGARADGGAVSGTC